MSNLDLGPDCERCGKRTKGSGDHLCGSCADELDREPNAPFWGAFPDHPDAKLNITPRSELRPGSEGKWL